MALTPTRIHDLAAGAATRRVRTEAEMNRFLDEHGVRDPEQRIAIKLQLEAQGELQTDRTLTIGELATDVSRHTPADPSLSPEMRALYRRARLDPARSYAPAEVDQALDDADLDVTSKIAIRTELAMRRQVRAAGARPTVQAGRDLSARAERPTGKILTDRQGRPLVLRSRP